MARKPKANGILIFPDRNGNFRASLVFSNGQIWATTEAYSSLAKCLSSAQIVSKGTNLPITLEALIEPPTKKTKKEVDNG